MIKLTEESKRCVNPYAIIDEITKETGLAPKRVFGNNRMSLTVEISSRDQGEKIRAIKKIDGYPCENVVNPRYNYTKALIYVHEFDLDSIEEFKGELQSRHKIVDVQPTTFINTRSLQTRVFIITFQQENLSYSIYIPGERQDTRVISFKDKPLMCKNCQQYGHAKKYCKKQEATCGKCAVVGHSVEQCDSGIVKCVLCSEAHYAGSRECSKYQKEEILIRIQVEEKMTANKMMANNNEYVERAKQQFNTHFNCKMNKSDKRKFTSWLLGKCLVRELDSKPKTIRTTNSTTFTVEVSDRKQSNKMQTITNIS